MRKMQNSASRADIRPYCCGWMRHPLEIKHSSIGWCLRTAPELTAGKEPFGTSSPSCSQMRRLNRGNTNRCRRRLAAIQRIVRPEAVHVCGGMHNTEQPVAPLTPYWQPSDSHCHSAAAPTQLDFLGASLSRRDLQVSCLRHAPHGAGLFYPGNLANNCPEVGRPESPLIAI